MTATLLHPPVPGAEADEFSRIETSQENVGLVAGDTIVILENDNADGRAFAGALEANPLWSTLPAVRSGRVIRISSQESVGSIGYQGLRSALNSLVTKWEALR